MTWVSTQACVGIACFWITPSSNCSRSPSAWTESDAGLMPITASPQPSVSPSRIAAVMPFGSSVGWLGWSRTASVPGSPIVLRKRVTTRALRATEIKSWLRMIFETAAAISGVTPGAIRVSTSGVAVSRNSRKSPTVRWAMSLNAPASCVSRISRVTSSCS